MKGTIVKCMQELVTNRFGAAKWKESLKHGGLPEISCFTTTEDVTDTTVMAIMNGIGRANSISMDQVMEAFGEYWSTVYGPSLYNVYFAKAKSTREFLLQLDDIHVAVTKTIKAAHPPRFQYRWKTDNVLIMQYESSRSLVALMPGLIRGLGKYYKDSPQVQVNGNSIQISF